MKKVLDLWAKVYIIVLKLTNCELLKHIYQKLRALYMSKKRVFPLKTRFLVL